MFGFFNDRNSGYLFSTQALHDLFRHRQEEMKAEVEATDDNRLLNTAPADFSAYLVEKYSLAAPTLRRSEWSVNAEEIQVDVSGDPGRHNPDRGRRVLVPGQRFDVFVPFDGEQELFYFQPSQAHHNPPRAVVSNGELIFTSVAPTDSDVDVKPGVERSLADIELHLGWQRQDMAVFNRGLVQSAQQLVDARRNRILANQGRVASMGIPVRTRPNTPQTYAVPTVRRKVPPAPPRATSSAFEPEPIWAMEHYEHALSVIQNMALVMERSPSTFATMKEEDLRQPFLVQLNGQFEGAATGETFNSNGKTDILLRVGGRNVFIAECKFWKGPKEFLATIDQLLGYTAWRDSKTAILIFNRGTNTSTVMAKVAETAETHPNFKRKISWNHQSGFRYVFHQAGDKNREFTVSVIVFDIPAIDTASE